MLNYKDILSGGGALADTEELSESGDRYTWDQIKSALSAVGAPSKIVSKLNKALSKVSKGRLGKVKGYGGEPKWDLFKTANEATTAGVGVGDYSPPLGMSRRDKDKFSSTTSMKKQFDQCVNTMGRSDMLGQCRKMGLSLGHLKDDDIRKTLNGMSVRNKRKFMGVASGMGMGSVDRWNRWAKPIDGK